MPRLCLHFELSTGVCECWDVSAAHHHPSVCGKYPVAEEHGDRGHGSCLFVVIYPQMGYVLIFFFLCFFFTSLGLLSGVARGGEQVLQIDKSWEKEREIAAGDGIFGGTVQKI